MSHNPKNPECQKNLCVEKGECTGGVVHECTCPDPSPSKTPREWEEEFDAQFSDYFGHGGEDHVKNFITRIELAAEERGRLIGMASGFEEGMAQHADICMRLHEREDSKHHMKVCMECQELGKKGEERGRKEALTSNPTALVRTIMREERNALLDELRAEMPREREEENFTGRIDKNGNDVIHGSPTNKGFNSALSLLRELLDSKKSV